MQKFYLDNLIKIDTEDDLFDQALMNRNIPKGFTKMNLALFKNVSFWFLYNKVPDINWEKEKLDIWREALLSHLGKSWSFQKFSQAITLRDFSRPIPLFLHVAKINKEDYSRLIRHNQRIFDELYVSIVQKNISLMDLADNKYF